MPVLIVNVYSLVSVQSLMMSGWWEEPVAVLVSWRLNTDIGFQWSAGQAEATGRRGQRQHQSCVDSWAVALLFHMKSMLALQEKTNGCFLMNVMDLNLHLGSVEHITQGTLTID